MTSLAIWDPTGRGDIPTFTLSEASIRFSDIGRLFWISQGKAATYDRRGLQICKVFIISQDLTYQKILKLVNF